MKITDCLDYYELNKRIKSFPDYYVCLETIDKCLTYSFVIVYSVFTLCLAFADVHYLVVSSAVNLFFLFIVSLIRIITSSERPYSKYKFEPLIEITNTNRSFPSRHMFSAVAISLTVLEYSYIASFVLLIEAFALGTIRIISGVHYLKDIIVGASFGIISGIIILFLK